MIKAVAFDLDDTLYDYETLNTLATERLCSFVCEALGIAPDGFYKAFEEAKRETKACLGGTASCHDRLLYCQKTLERLGRPPAVLALDMYDRYWGYILGHMKLREGALETLTYCRERGLRVAVCTDLTAHIQHRKLRRLGIAPLVDVLVTSEEAGAEKPSEAIYRLLLKKLGAVPEQILFVGDSDAKDVQGPLRMGMRALRFGAAEGKYAAADFEAVRRKLDEIQQH